MVFAGIKPSTTVLLSLPLYRQYFSWDGDDSYGCDGMNQIAETAVWQTCLCSSQSIFVPWTIQCKPCVLLVGGIQFNPYYIV